VFEYLEITKTHVLIAIWMFIHINPGKYFGRKFGVNHQDFRGRPREQFEQNFFIAINVGLEFDYSYFYY
jgi:hypothetical protein